MGKSPKYMIIVDWVREQIDNHLLKPGDRFLSEAALSEKFGLSRQTVRHAMGILENNGYVNRVQGSGTYVRGRRAPHHTPSMNVGVISTYLDDYIFPSIIRGMESVFTSHGYAIQFSFTNNRIANESRTLLSMIDKNLDGLIIEPTKSGIPSVNMELYKSLISHGTPLVFFNAYYPELDAPYVALDDKQAGYSATRYLIEQGHSRIAGIFLHNDLQGHLRYSGYIKALVECGLPVIDENIIWYSTEGASDLLKGAGLLETLDRCSAVFCYNDQLAIRLIDLLKTKGLRVPADVSVIGIDNSDISAMCSPPLTTLAHPAQELGAAAAELLVSMIGGTRGENVLFRPKLIERSSVVPPAK